MKKIKSSTSEFAAASKVVSDRYELCLFIAGMTSLSTRALENLIAICDERLPGKYDLRVVDIYQEPESAKLEQIVAVPTLLKKSPGPRRRLIGDLSNRVQVLRGLDLQAQPATTSAPPRKKGTREKAR